MVNFSQISERLDLLDHSKSLLAVREMHEFISINLHPLRYEKQECFYIQYA